MLGDDEEDEADEEECMFEFGDIAWREEDETDESIDRELARVLTFNSATSFSFVWRASLMNASRSNERELNCSGSGTATELKIYLN